MSLLFVRLECGDGAATLLYYRFRWVSDIIGSGTFGQSFGLRPQRWRRGTVLPVALIGPKCTTTQLRHYLDQGAAGYLPYSLAPDALLAALRVVATGEPYAPVDMMAKDDVPDQKRNGWLTGRERDVLNGLLAGQSNKEIAREHGLSEVTIKHHLKSLRSKLRARNRTHAVYRAIELGIAEEGQVAL